MNIRRLIPVLIGVVLISFALGIFSLLYNDNYSFANIKSGNFLSIKSRDGIVKIGTDGIEVKDGDDHVSIGWDGINVNDGKDQVRVGWDGIKVGEDGKSIFNFGKNFKWFGIGSKDLKWETIDEEKFAEIEGINNISVSSSFIDIKVTSADRDNVRICYYGTMKSNVVPSLEVDVISNKLDIKLKNPKSNSYSVVDSDVVLEVFVPKSFNSDINVSTSSGDIYMKDLLGKIFNMSASSGQMKLENLQGELLNLSTSSGDIGLEDFIGNINVTSSSGGVTLNSYKTSGDMKIATSSGDVSIGFGDDANYKISGSTSSGDVEFIGPVSLEKDRSGNFQLGIGSEEKSININTSSGDIVFKKR